MKNSKIQNRRPALSKPPARRSGGRRSAADIDADWEEAVKKGIEEYDRQHAIRRSRGTQTK